MEINLLMWAAPHLAQPLKTAESYKCLSEYEVIDCYYTVKTCLMLGEEIEESGKPAVTGN